MFHERYDMKGLRRWRDFRQLQDLRGVPLMALKHRTVAGAHFGTPSDDGVPQVPLKSRYLSYRDFASVQPFAAISGTIPLAPT